MKKKLHKFYKFTLIALICGISLTACSDDKNYYYGYKSYTKFFDVKRANWEWNSNLNRYECYMLFNELTKDIYDNGTIQATVFIPDNSGEVQSTLPFVQSYPIVEGSTVVGTYTETISYDISVGDICFYIQANDLSDDDTYLIDREFKVTLFWDWE